MNYFTPIAVISLIASQLIFAEPTEDPQPSPDLLRFANNDTLQGNFLSFGTNQSLVWNNPQSDKPINFSTKKLHRIILNKGKAHQKTSFLSHVKLTNGDVIPGKIISADRKQVLLETQHLGELEIPCTKISKISPTPFGGKNIYYGPLNDSEWKTLRATEIENDDTATSTDEEEADAPSDWEHIGAAWYSGTDKSRFLIKENTMPDKCRLSFKLGWRGNLYTHIVLHADFSPPQYEHPSSNKLDMAATVGQAYILSLSSYSATLTACTFDEDGRPNNTRIKGTQQSLRLSGQETADIDIRIDRITKNIFLFINGNFKGKWELGEDYAGKGKHLAFKNLLQSTSPMRVSDIIISEWNGMRDSANSMKSSERDTILLNNGLDRFSGTFTELRENKVSFKGSFDNEMTIPMDEITEIQFATSEDKTKIEENPQNVYFYIFPHGRITGLPSQGPEGKTQLINDLLGEIVLDTSYINLIDFSHKNSLLDNWDDNF